MEVRYQLRHSPSSTTGGFPRGDEKNNTASADPARTTPGAQPSAPTPPPGGPAL